MNQCLFYTTCVICKKPQEVLKQIPAVCLWVQAPCAFSFLKATSPDLVQPHLLFQPYCFFSAGCFANTAQSQSVLSGTVAPHTSVAELDLLIFGTFPVPALSSPSWTAPFTAPAATSSAASLTGLSPCLCCGVNIQLPPAISACRFLHTALLFQDHNPETATVALQSQHVSHRACACGIQAVPCL